MTFARPDPADASATLLAIKAVPGASRDAIAGPLGDRLKVRVAAPPEEGKANEAIRRLIADALSVPTSAVTLVAGPARAEKMVRVAGITASEAIRRLRRMENSFGTEPSAEADGL